MARASPLCRGGCGRTSFGSAGYPVRTVEALDLASAIVLTPSLGRSPRDRLSPGPAWKTVAFPRSTSFDGWVVQVALPKLVHEKFVTTESIDGRDAKVGIVARA